MSNNFKLYTQSAEIVRDFLTAKGSLKNLCYAPHIDQKKAVMALVHQSLKFRSVLVEALSMAQVPGFRYHDLKRYERVLYENTNNLLDLSPATEDDIDEDEEVNSDEEYEREILRRKKARTAGFHKNKNKDGKDGKETSVEDDDDDLMDHDAEDDNLGITDSWHSCMVNVFVPAYKLNTYVAPVTEESGGRNKKRKHEQIKKDDGKGKALRARYLREVMLVLAYDLLFGRGLARLDSINAHEVNDKVGVLSAIRMLSGKICPAYISDEEMVREATKEAKETKYTTDANGQITLIKKQDKSTQGLYNNENTSAIKPKWGKATSSVTPKWGRPTTTITPINISRPDSVVHHMKNQGSLINTVDNTSDGDDDGKVHFYSLQYTPPKDWNFSKRLKSALTLIKGKRGIIATNNQNNPNFKNNEELEKLSKSAQNELLLPVSLRDHYGRKFPRYARINTLVMSVHDAIQQVKDLGYTFLDTIPEEYRNEKLKISNDTEIADFYSKNKIMRVDNDNSNVGVLDEEYTRLYKYSAGTIPAVKNGKGSLQNKGKSSQTKTQVKEDEEDSGEKPTTPEYICWIDQFVPNVICFLPTDHYILQSEMVTEHHSLIIQDKASSFPPLALLPPPDSTVIDGCSAPGNKTSFLSALMKGRGRLFAIELNARRAKLMDNRMQQAGAKNVQVVNTSFFSIDPTDDKYKNTEYILLDPSCSGSGNPSLDVLLANDGKMHTSNSGHVKSLSDLQVSLCKHAFTFPKLKKLVYSTCSIYCRENEGVILRLIAEAKKHGFKLMPCLPNWSCRGMNSVHYADISGINEVATENKAHKNDDYKIPVPNGDFTARIYADEYHTGGFYVACFVKEGLDNEEFEQNLHILNETKTQYGILDEPLVEYNKDESTNTSDNLNTSVNEYVKQSSSFVPPNIKDNTPISVITIPKKPVLGTKKKMMVKKTTTIVNKKNK